MIGMPAGGAAGGVSVALAGALSASSKRLHRAATSTGRSVAGRRPLHHAAQRGQADGVTRLLRLLSPLLGVLLFVVAVEVLRRALHAYHWAEVAAELRAIVDWRLALALVLTAGSYLALTGYDVLALDYVGARLSYARVALASFVGYALSHNLGAALLSGGAIRYRLYSAWGLTALDVGKVVLFDAAAFWLGFLVVLGATFVAGGLPPGLAAHLPPAAARAAGIAALALVAGYLVLCARRPGPLRWRELEIGLPPPRLAAAQIAIATLDWLLAAAVLCVLLPGGAASFGRLVGAFAVAQIAGVASTVPAGLGVFETGIILLLAHRGAGPALLGSLVAYRLVYYLVPLMLAVAAARRARARGAARHDAAGGRARSAAGRLASCRMRSRSDVRSRASCCWSPGRRRRCSNRLGWLARRRAPSAARGLPLRRERRRRRAPAARARAPAAAGRRLGPGVGAPRDGHRRVAAEGPRLGGGGRSSRSCSAALVRCRRQFDRRAALLASPLTRRWVVAVAAGRSCGVTWLLLVAYRHVEYTNELWWQFELEADAPRSLRAPSAPRCSSSAWARAGSCGTHRRSRWRRRPRSSSGRDGHRRGSPAPSAHLALLGDKTFLLSTSGAAFVMYAGRRAAAGWRWAIRCGRSRSARELAWRFRELGDRHGGRTVFYEVGDDHLPIYLELGLTLLKLGEEARVPLTGFSLEGTRGKGSARRTAMPSATAAASRSCLRPASPSCSASSAACPTRGSPRRRRARRASRSASSRRTTSVPVRWRWCGRSSASSRSRTCGSAPSTRSSRSTSCATGPDAPAGLMDYLFVELMLWGSRQGYRWFNLGMAPLAGLERSRSPRSGIVPAPSSSGTASISTASRGSASTRRSSSPRGRRATSPVPAVSCCPRCS